MSNALKKALRTLLQVIAGGGLTALVAVVADGLTPTQAGIVMTGWTAVVTYVQNYLEDVGVVPKLLK